MWNEKIMREKRTPCWENWYHLVWYSSHLASNHICQEQWGVCQYLAARQTCCPFIFITPEDKSLVFSNIEFRHIITDPLHTSSTNLCRNLCFLNTNKDRIVAKLHSSAPDQSIFANLLVREFISIEELSILKLDEDN